MLFCLCPAQRGLQRTVVPIGLTLRPSAAEVLSQCHGSNLSKASRDMVATFGVIVNVEMPALRHQQCEVSAAAVAC